jgi:hypothetical protein
MSAGIRLAATPHRIRSAGKAQNATHAKLQDGNAICIAYDSKATLFLDKKFPRSHSRIDRRCFADCIAAQSYEHTLPLVPIDPFR